MSGTPIAQPSISVSLVNADTDVQNTAQRVLLVGQKVAAGSAVSGTLIEQIASTGSPENALFGENSMIAEMVRAFKAVNQLTRVDVISLDDAAGVPRLVDFVVVGTATAAGTITVTVGSELLHEFAVAIAIGDTETDVADAIILAVNADTKVGFTASNVAGAVSLTADNDGTVYNDLGMEVVITDAAGITVPAGVVETTPGATDPTLTSVLASSLGRYQAIVWPYADTSDLRTFLDARFNLSNSVQDGVGIVTLQDTTATLVAATVEALNTQSLVAFCDKQESETLYKGPAQNEASFVKSTIFAAIRALRLTDSASISHLLTSTASLDQFGGAALASLPYFNTPLVGLPIIKAGRGWTNTEIEQIATAGGSVMGVNLTGTSVLIGEVYTTYKTDAGSNPDPTWEFLNYVDTASGAREYFFNNLRSQYAQSRLTEGAVVRGRDQVNQVMIEAYLDKLYQDLSGPDFVLVQGGETAIQFFKTNRTVTLDLTTGTATITMLVPIVTQLRVIVATLKIAFTTQA